MSPRKKAAYHHGDLRQALIDEAVDMIAGGGVASVTMRSLSDRLGVSRTAAYRHFADKDELLCAVSEEGFRRFREVLKAARDAHPCDPGAGFTAMGSAYVRFALDHPAHYRLMFRESLATESGSLESAAEAAFLELVHALEALQEAGLTIGDDARSQAVFVWSLMHGFSTLLADRKLPETTDTEALLSFVKRTLLRAIERR